MQLGVGYSLEKILFLLFVLLKDVTIYVSPILFIFKNTLIWHSYEYQDMIPPKNKNHAYWACVLWHSQSSESNIWVDLLSIWD